MLADMVIWTPWKHYNAAEQQNEANKQGNVANNKRDRKNAKKRHCKNIASYITQILKKRIPNEHNFETNTTACKYLNNSRHGNLLLEN